jgi:MerR family transcriptional regulator/heat shock protein HspR
MRRFYIEVYRPYLSPYAGDIWINVNSLDVHPDIIESLAELGIVEVRRGYIPASHAVRVKKLLRLRRSLGVNLPGATVILDLLERMEMLEEEIARLKEKVKSHGY